MKTFLLGVICIFLTIFTTKETRTITGTVTDESGEALIGVKVLTESTEKSTLTDIEGKFSLEVSESEKTLVFSYIGYQTKELKLSLDSTYTVVMKESKGVLEECVVVGVGISDKSKREIRIRGASLEARAPDIKYSKAKKSKKSFPVLAIGDVASPSAPSIETHSFIEAEIADFTSSEEIAAGQITAGEWNDLNNWEDWKSLLKEDDYKNMQDHWKIFPNERYSVFVTNENNFPLINADVTLWSQDGHAIWKTKSDGTGKAELWNGFQRTALDIKKITVEKDNNTFTIKKPKSSEKGSNHLQVPLPCMKHSGVDIMFVVDATGSMGDEINFLRSELSDVISRVKENDSDLTYRTGAVFYKDETDDYLTAQTDLSEDFSKTIDFIKAKNAGGGGDYPEAVDAALDKVLAQDWNKDALSRLVFLLLDAPPHDDEQTMLRIRNQIEEAAKKGIKIIPITASGINRETEFLMKFMSISTNGTYVFITDDSGIGNPHLDPVVSDYEVEKLNDLLVRVISNYSYQEICGQRKNIVQTDLEFKLYPNPASRLVNLELDQKVDRIVLRSASGKIVLTEENPKKGKNKIRLDNLVGGMYIISILKDDKVLESKSLMIIG